MKNFGPEKNWCQLQRADFLVVKLRPSETVSPKLQTCVSNKTVGEKVGQNYLFRHLLLKEYFHSESQLDLKDSSCPIEPKHSKKSWIWECQRVTRELLRQVQICPTEITHVTSRKKPSFRSLRNEGHVRYLKKRVSRGAALHMEKLWAHRPAVFVTVKNRVVFLFSPAYAFFVEIAARWLARAPGARERWLAGGPTRRQARLKSRLGPQTSSFLSETPRWNEFLPHAKDTIFARFYTDKRTADFTEIPWETHCRCKLSQNDCNGPRKRSTGGLSGPWAHRGWRGRNQSYRCRPGSSQVSIFFLLYLLLRLPQ